MKVTFAPSTGSLPPVATRIRIQPTRATSVLWVQRRTSTFTWDVVVTLPDGRTAVLPKALRTDP
jgi:hypothetical protein